MLRRFSALALFLIGCQSHPATPEPPAIHVYPTGPLTLHQALERSRQPGQPRRILLHTGTYTLDYPLILTPADSGLELLAAPTARPVLSGGRAITKWTSGTLNGRPCAVADIPDAGNASARFRELYVNGRRATRARHPNAGYLKVAESPDAVGKPWNVGQSRFVYAASDIPAGDAPPPDAEAIVFIRWVEARMPIASIDRATRTLNLLIPSTFGIAPSDQYYLEGSPAWLDTPGEWYADFANAKLYYLPREDEPIAKLSAVAPRLTQVIQLKGDPDHAVERVAIRGLTLSHTHYPLELAKSPEGKIPAGFVQAAYGVPGALTAEYARDCTLEHCTVEHVGTYALELTRGCQSNHILNCTIRDTGAGGVKIGQTTIAATDADKTRDNEIRNCRIGDGGHTFASAVGVWIGQSPGNTLARNEIHDLYYSGISVGWTWGSGPADAAGNTIEHNLVHHIGAKRIADKGATTDGPLLSDMAGIYTLGRQPGTVIRNNTFHDIAASKYGGWGIYTDEGSAEILIEKNLVYRTTHGGFHQHYGRDNTVRNNIFAFGRDVQIAHARNEGRHEFTFQRNIVYWDKGPLAANPIPDATFDHNLYWNTTQSPILLGKTDFKSWQATGKDEHSILADPLFHNPTADDFRLQPNSPASQIDFEPWNPRDVGPQP